MGSIVEFDLVTRRKVAAGAADISRGVARLLINLGYSVLEEFPLAIPRRVDLIGINDKNHTIVIEVKSCVADFRNDQKWAEYSAYCDAFYFGIGTDFPKDVLPNDVGIIVADRFGADIVRAAEDVKMNGNARRKQTLRFGRIAAHRLYQEIDPNFIE